MFQRYCNCKTWQHIGAKNRHVTQRHFSGFQVEHQTPQTQHNHSATLTHFTFKFPDNSLTKNISTRTGNKIIPIKKPGAKR